MKRKTKQILKSMFAILLVFAMTVTVLPAQETPAASKWTKKVSKTFTVKNDVISSYIVVKVKKPCTVTVHSHINVDNRGVCKGTSYTGEAIQYIDEPQYDFDKQTLDIKYKLKKGTYCFYQSTPALLDKYSITIKTSGANLKFVKSYTEKYSDTEGIG